MAILFERVPLWGQGEKVYSFRFTLWPLFQAISFRLLSFKRSIGKMLNEHITFIQLLETGFKDPACPC